jgi:hypothetical protein
VVIAVAIVVAAFTRFFQLAPPLFRFPAVLTVPADRPLQVCLRLLDATFALVITIQRLRWGSTSQQEKRGQDRRQDSVPSCHRPSVPENGGILHPEAARTHLTSGGSVHRMVVPRDEL